MPQESRLLKAVMSIYLARSDYHTEDNNTKTAEDTLVDVQKYAASVGIPYSYVLLDSWWYYKGNDAGVTVWNARPDVFPDGLAGFFRKTHWPTMLHNRMWATDSNYSTANGGQYTFINDGSDVRAACAPISLSYHALVRLRWVIRTAVWGLLGACSKRSEILG